MSASRKTSCSLLLQASLILLLSIFQQTECFKWVENVYTSSVYANRSQPAIFRWKYSLEGADLKSLKIKCGYLEQTRSGPTTIGILVKKQGHNSGMTVSGRLPGSVNSQVEPYSEMLPGGGVDRSIVGFKILYAQLTHPRKYMCQVIYRVGTDDLDTKQSELKQLVVLDPPVLVNCLQDLQEVKEDKDIEFSCYVTGNPPPTLQCQLLSYWRDVLQKYPESASTSNITRHMFQKVDRDAEQIMCVADGGEHTGTANVTVDIFVHHTPHAPDHISFEPATNQSCLNISWAVIPNNETGGEILSYQIQYWETTHGEISAETVLLPVESLKPIKKFYSHQICGLSPDIEYTVKVIGINVNGDGHFDLMKVVPSSIAARAPDEDEASVGVIIGGIIAGIVFIVIFVVLAVWCSTRSKKHEKFPTSHVEDAVDYPPGVGEALYASARYDKNKNKTSIAGSAHEYPDVVNDTSDSKPMMTSSNSYEQSNKIIV